MMLALQDGSLRIVVLTHLIGRLQQGAGEEFVRAGIEPGLIDRLRTLDASDIKRLAALPHPMIALDLDVGSVNTGLRHLAVIKDVQALEDYFIRNGASPKMMRALFRMAFATTRLRRQALGENGRYGRPALPTVDVRDEIHRVWAAHAKLDVRQRFYRLHKAYPAYRLDTLNAVVTEFELNKA
jgi:hypothetical protein